MKFVCIRNVKLMNIKYLFGVIIGLFISCESTSQSLKSKKTMDNELKYLALGDSYTIGESVSESQRWPVQLVEKLRNTGKKIAPPKIIAKTGWTTDELKARIIKENVIEKFDLVSLLIGVNNQYRGRNAEEFRKEFVDLLETAIQFADNNKNRVFVVSIPDWGVTPFGLNSSRPDISKSIDLFNAICKAETEKRGILYIDITPISRKAPDDASLIAEDGLHPSGKMYQMWTEKIQPLIMQQLN